MFEDLDLEKALLKKEERRHKHAEACRAWREKQKPEYAVWESMNKRCHYEFNPSYQWYGGKGIEVCFRWRSGLTKDAFKNFLSDVGPKPGPEYDLDRKDPNKNYSPDNCRWLHRSLNRAKVEC